MEPAALVVTKDMEVLPALPDLERSHLVTKSEACAYPMLEQMQNNSIIKPFLRSVIFSEKLRRNLDFLIEVSINKECVLAYKIVK
jgi:hypothetical protein